MGGQMPLQFQAPLLQLTVAEQGAGLCGGRCDGRALLHFELINQHAVQGGPQLNLHFEVQILGLWFVQGGR